MGTATVFVALPADAYPAGTRDGALRLAVVGGVGGGRVKVGPFGLHPGHGRRPGVQIRQLTRPPRGTPRAGPG